MSQSTRNQVPITMQRRFFLQLPKLAEQQKIATFLGSIDTKLNKLRRKRERLETWKRSLMQKIFSQQLRFTQDDGTDFFDWEEKKVSDVYRWVKTNSLSREKLTCQKGDIQNIHYGDIHTKYFVQFDQDVADAPFIKDRKSSKNITETEFCKNGDIVIADASEDLDDIGKSIEIINVKSNSLVAGLHTYIARPKDSFRSGFSGYLFQSNDFRKQVKRIAQGVSVLGISKTNFEKLDIPQPVPEEQQKIANSLSSIDKKIQAVTNQITHTETFKKGLLQKMFV
ncbi:restriction endonuclease subunit S [Candidatus Vondammii sp. HM_W22]|uniref:restriction endonuclease subunit S n=1 Tax=Candidatus Vondammii sp. HM_W22 TaxID=2687299 RepID=UPI001F141366|nr:restriction endonuclease subunit S [Candidatus Vondammii sp. HM_W22]